MYVQLSMGIALCPDAAAEPDALMRDAAVAMRRAKRDGGGVGRLYDRTLDSQFAERLGLESELHRALDNGELRVHYQPLIRGSQGWSSVSRRSCAGKHPCAACWRPRRSSRSPRTPA